MLSTVVLCIVLLAVIAALILRIRALEQSIEGVREHARVAVDLAYQDMKAAVVRSMEDAQENVKQARQMAAQAVNTASRSTELIAREIRETIKATTEASLDTMKTAWLPAPQLQGPQTGTNVPYALPVPFYSTPDGADLTDPTDDLLRESQFQGREDAVIASDDSIPLVVDGKLMGFS